MLYKKVSYGFFAYIWAIKASFFKIPEVIRENVSNLEKLSMKPGMVTGISCGFTDLDNLTAGFQPSDLIILAARPSMGKTSFALDIARFVSLHEDIPTAIFSLEMSRHCLLYTSPSPRDRG